MQDQLSSFHLILEHSACNLSCGLINDAKQAMVCTADDLQEWKDFPKGLRVLLLDEDGSSAAEIKPKLEAMDYIVSTFYNKKEALSAITSRPESFHVAIVEVSQSNSEGHLQFLENAKDLATIITSDVHCLDMMMKCIALGAVEFMMKPLSEDKLRNIWQHVVHKAFNSGMSSNSKTLKPIKESLVSILQIRKEDEVHDAVYCQNPSGVDEMDSDPSSGNDKYPAPSTPQIQHVVRSHDDGDCQDQNNCSTEKESGDQDGKSKSADKTCNAGSIEASLTDNLPICLRKTMMKEEGDLVDIRKSENETSFHSQNEHETSLHSQNEKDLSGINIGHTSPSKSSVLRDSTGMKANRKKVKVDWTPELHKKFVQAVEQLGIDQAIPSRILEVMKVEGLTRHNVASHLQKYRMHKRHILPKEDERRWLHQRDQKQKCYYQQRPITAFPQYYPNRTLPTVPVYPMWGHSASYTPSVQMWGSPAYPLWQPQECGFWKPSPEMHADAWGCPVMPHSQGAPFHPKNQLRFHNTNGVDYSRSMPQNSFLLDRAEEVIDKVVKEAISKPWLPLPLGLKPPSTDSVLAELTRQGISNIPSCSKAKLVNNSHCD